MASAKAPVGQRAGGYEHEGAFVESGHLALTCTVMIRVAFRTISVIGGGEDIPVHCQRTAGRHAGGLLGTAYSRWLPSHLHFQLEQAGRQSPGGSALQRIGADQLGKAGTFMGGRKLARFLFVQVYLHTGVRQPQRGFAPRQTGTDHVYLHSHSVMVSALFRHFSLLFDRLRKAAALFGAVELAFFLKQGLAALGDIFQAQARPRS